MTIIRKVGLITFLIAIAVLFSLRDPGTANASEGTVELKSTGREPYRCYAVSIRMQEPEYRILFTCKFILYPVDENTFYYVAWATPESGKDVRLGIIGSGRGEFKTKNKFKSIYITTEVNKEARNPSGRIVMRGNVEPIAFMEEVKYYEPTPTIQSQEQTNLSPIPEEESNGEISPAPDTQSTKDKIFTAFKRAGVAAVVAMVALAGLIFVITRSRG